MLCFVLHKFKNNARTILGNNICMNIKISRHVPICLFLFSVIKEQYRHFCLVIGLEFYIIPPLLPLLSKRDIHILSSIII